MHKELKALKRGYVPMYRNEDLLKIMNCTVPRTFLDLRDRAGDCIQLDICISVCIESFIRGLKWQQVCYSASSLSSKRSAIKQIIDSDVCSEVVWLGIVWTMEVCG